MTLTSHAEITETAPGKFRQEQSIKPIAFLRNGAYSRITNALGSSGDPAFPVGVDELVQFRIKDKLAGQSPVVHFGKGQTMVRFTPLNTNNTNGAPIGDNGWRYPEAWNNTDLELIIAGYRLQKNIILRTGHPMSFGWRIDENIGLNQDTLETADFRILPPVLENGTETIPLSWIKTVSGGKLILTCDLPSGDWSGWTLDPTIVLQPGAADGLDTYLVRDAPTLNTGNEATYAVGSIAAGGDRYRELVKFDLSGIPAGSSITSATLDLYLFNKDAINPPTRTYQISRILAANSAWTELGATWNTINGVTAWAGQLGCHQSGVDYSATPMHTNQDFPAIGLHSLTLNTAEFSSMVVANYGFVHFADAIATEVQYRFYRTSDYTTSTERPKLTIEYTLGGAAAKLYHYRRRRVN